MESNNPATENTAIQTHTERNYGLILVLDSTLHTQNIWDQGAMSTDTSPFFMLICFGLNLSTSAQQEIRKLLIFRR